MNHTTLTLVIIILAIGAWMRRRAEAQEYRDKQLDRQTESLERITKLAEKEKDERGRVNYTKDSQM